MDPKKSTSKTQKIKRPLGPIGKAREAAAAIANAAITKDSESSKTTTANESIFQLDNSKIQLSVKPCTSEHPPAPPIIPQILQGRKLVTYVPFHKTRSTMRLHNVPPAPAEHPDGGCVYKQTPIYNDNVRLYLSWDLMDCIHRTGAQFYFN